MTEQFLLVDIFFVLSERVRHFLQRAEPFVNIEAADDPREGSVQRTNGTLIKESHSTICQHRKAKDRANATLRRSKRPRSRRREWFEEEEMEEKEMRRRNQIDMKS